nr:MAG TPA_asm: hypothetical protein [Caudoviricetes sp.]
MGTHRLDIQPRTNLGTRKYQLDKALHALLGNIRCDIGNINQILRNTIGLCRVVLNDAVIELLVPIIDTDKGIRIGHLLDGLTQIPQTLACAFGSILFNISRDNLELCIENRFRDSVHLFHRCFDFCIRATAHRAADKQFFHVSSLERNIVRVAGLIHVCVGCSIAVRIALCVRIGVLVLLHVHHVRIQRKLTRSIALLHEICLAADVLNADKVQLADGLRRAQQTLALQSDPVDMWRPLGLQVDRNRNIEGRHERFLIGVVRVGLGLLDLDTHIYHLLRLLHRRNHDVDAALVRTETVTGRVTREIGLVNKTGIVNIDFLTLLEHKYQISLPYL